LARNFILESAAANSVDGIPAYSSRGISAITASS
jgi:hypothetical protein